MYILGLLNWHSSSGIICTFSLLSVLMFTSTTAQLLGGRFAAFLSDTAYLFFVGISSGVSMSFSRLIVSILVLFSVQWTPAQLSLAKSLPSITGLVMFWHTKVCLNVRSPMLISQLILPMAPKLVPSAPTTFISPLVSSGPSFSLLYMSPDITLLVAPVSKSEFILVCLIDVGKTVPSADPAIPMSVEAAISHISSL